MSLVSSREQLPSTLAGDGNLHFAASAPVTITSTTQKVQVSGNFTDGSNNSPLLAKMVWGFGYGTDNGSTANSTPNTGVDGQEGLLSDLISGTQAFGSTSATFTGITPGTYRFGFFYTYTPAGTGNANYFNLNDFASTSVVVSN